MLISLFMEKATKMIKNNSKFIIGIIVGLLIGFTMGVGLASIAKNNQNSSQPTQVKTSTQGTFSSSQTVSSKNVSSSSVSSKNVSSSNETTSQQKTISSNGNSTFSQSQALKKAKDYLKSMAFSYSGLIHQLEYEKYSTEDATYAVDNCGADWQQQAIEKAKDYLKMMSFSKEQLKEQLKYEGFTEEQSSKAVDEVYK